MPKQEQTIAIANMDAETALAVSYQAFKNLGWDILFAGPDKILAQSTKKWNSNPQHVIAGYGENELMVSSEMIMNEVADITGKNRKNINAFTAAFEEAKTSMNDATIEGNKQALKELQAATEIAAENETKEAEEIDKAMNLSGSNLYVTYGIMAINVIVFILMVMNGAGIMEPNGYVHIKWGSNFTALTLTGDWWRLVTNIFIHFGIIHIAMNMYCLYIVGVYLEPMLGKTKYIAAYLCTGILASLVSLWWHKEGVNSAGASGAIFGLYGLFLALLTTKLIPERVRKAQLQSIGIFVAYNLIYGMKGGVDNSAHVGGLISGFVIGYLYAISIKREKEDQKAAWVLPLILIATVGITAGYLSSNKGSDAERVSVLNELKGTSYADNEKYTKDLEEIGKIEDKAVDPLSDTTLTDAQLKSKMESECLPLWKQAEEKLYLMKGYDVAPNQKMKAEKLLEYVQLRKEELAIFNKRIDGGEEEKFITDLNAVRAKINKLALEIQKL